MIKTIMTMVGIVVAMFFLVFVVVTIPNLLNAGDSVGIANLKNRSAAGRLVVSWETSGDTNAFLHYSIGGTNYTVKDHSYKKTHKLEAPAGGGTVIYHVESCTIVGECERSEEYEVAVSGVPATCSNGVRDGGETGIDCGGPCPGGCCSNGYQDVNLGEQGVDCGGPCAPCSATGAVLKVIANKIVVTDQVRVIISVENVQDLAGVQLDLDFDSSKLQYVGKTDGSFLGSCPVDPVVVGSAVTNIACVSLTGGKSGNGDIITLFFDIQGSGPVTFSISNEILSDPGMNPIPATTSPATITV